MMGWGAAPPFVVLAPFFFSRWLPELFLECPALRNPLCLTGSVHLGQLSSMVLCTRVTTDIRRSRYEKQAKHRGLVGGPHVVMVLLSNLRVHSGEVRIPGSSYSTLPQQCPVVPSGFTNTLLTGSHRLPASFALQAYWWGDFGLPVYGAQFLRSRNLRSRTVLPLRILWCVPRKQHYNEGAGQTPGVPGAMCPGCES